MHQISIVSTVHKLQLYKDTIGQICFILFCDGINDFIIQSNCLNTPSLSLNISFYSVLCLGFFETSTSFLNRTTVQAICQVSFFVALKYKYANPTAPAASNPIAICHFKIHDVFLMFIKSQEAIKKTKLAKILQSPVEEFINIISST